MTRLAHATRAESYGNSEAMAAAGRLTGFAKRGYAGYILGDTNEQNTRLMTQQGALRFPV